MKRHTKTWQWSIILDLLADLLIWSDVWKIPTVNRCITVVYVFTGNIKNTKGIIIFSTTGHRCLNSKSAWSAYSCSGATIRFWTDFVVQIQYISIFLCKLPSKIRSSTIWVADKTQGSRTVKTQLGDRTWAAFWTSWWQNNRPQCQRQ